MTKVSDRLASALNVFPPDASFAAPERLEKMRVGYVNQYAWPDGAAFWGKPHATRAQAENAAVWCQFDGKRVVALAVVRWKPKPTAATAKTALAAAAEAKYPGLRPGTLWRHTNQNIYKIEKLTNLLDNKRYPLTVVYVGENGASWSRLASDWHRSMTRVYTVTPVSPLRALFYDRLREAARVAAHLRNNWRTQHPDVVAAWDGIQQAADAEWDPQP